MFTIDICTLSLALSLKKRKNFQAPRTKGEKVTNSVSLKDKNVMKKKY